MKTMASKSNILKTLCNCRFSSGNQCTGFGILHQTNLHSIEELLLLIELLQNIDLNVQIILFNY